MAEGTGVVSTPSKPPESTSKKPGAKGLMKNKPLLILGGAGALVLLLGHKGSSSSAGNNASTAAQLQAANDALAAQQAANASPSYAASDPGTSSTPAIQPTTSTDSGAVTGSVGAADTQTGAGTFAAGEAGGIAAYQAGIAGGLALAKQPGAPATPKPKPGTPKPKQPPKGKPAPATNKGKHPSTSKKTPSGAKKNSPVQVESPRGAGSGVMVLGREFPGALGHHMGPPMRASDGTIMRRVTLDYGGHTETHIAHGNGNLWTDRAPGYNPPSRGVPVTQGPVTI